MSKHAAARPRRFGRNKSQPIASRRRIRKEFLAFIAVLLLFLVLSSTLVFKTLPGQPKKRKTPIVPVLSIDGLKKPLAVSVDASNRLYVSDSGRGKLKVYGATGSLVGVIGGDAVHERFQGLFGSVVGPEGLIYASDWQRQAISVFSANGRLERRFPQNPKDEEVFGKRGFTPFGMDMFRGSLYVAGNDGIYVFSPQGRLLRKFTSPDDDIVGFSYPSAVAVDKKDGSIYVTDQLNHRVVAMTAEGATKWVVGRKNSQGDIVSPFGLPRGLTLDGRGRLYVSDTFFHRVVVLGRDGSLISVIGGMGKIRGRFSFPEGLAIDRSGRLVVSDRENNRVQVLKIRRFPKPSKQFINKYRRSFLKG